jgi:helix-turn-helix domain of resolvase
MLLSEQQLSDIDDLLKKGVPKTKIAKQYRISVSTLYRYLSLPDDRLEAKLAANQKIDEVKRLSNIGVPKTRIAKELGISVRTVHRYLSPLKPVMEQEKAPTPASKPFAHTGGTSREKREARKREIEQLVSADLAALQPTPDDDYD